MLSPAKRLRRSAVSTSGHSGAPGQPRACACARTCRACLRRASCGVPLVLSTWMPGKKPDVMRPPGHLGRRRCVLHSLTAGRLCVVQVPHSQSETTCPLPGRAWPPARVPQHAPTRTWAWTKLPGPAPEMGAQGPRNT
eukprot:1442205-Alexandrium_andersonii.AAC.1